MSWLNTENFKELFADTANISDTRLEEYLSSAIDKLELLVGESAVNDATLESPSEPKRALRLRRAQGHFAYMALLLNASGRIRDGGIVDREQDISSPTGGGAVINSYLSPDKVNILLKQHEAEAMQAIQPYLKDESADTDKITSVLVGGGMYF